MTAPPAARAIIALQACLVNRKAPPRITPVWRFHSSKDMSMTPFLLKKAALFTRMSTLPKAAIAASTAALTCASSVTSQVTPTARPPLPLM